MNIQRILCPIDFSDFNHDANEYASMFAAATGAKIVYLHAYLPDPYETPPMYYDADKTEEELTEKLKEFIKPIDDKIVASYVIAYGTIADRIVNYANEHHIDLVVLGTHGRTGLRRALMGSVAEAVVRKADCPVLAVKSASKVTQKA